MNITKHNEELRKDLNVEKTFVNTFNVGYESFSSSWKLQKMHPVIGNRGEFLFLALFLPSILLLKASR